MPVVDTPVHPKTSHTDLRSERCQKAVRKEGYFVLTRHYFEDGRYELRNEFVPDNLSEHCRQINLLPECVGCKATKDVEYIDRMKAL